MGLFDGIRKGYQAARPGSGAVPSEKLPREPIRQSTWDVPAPDRPVPEPPRSTGGNEIAQLQRLLADKARAVLNAERDAKALREENNRLGKEVMGLKNELRDRDIYISDLEQQVAREGSR